MDKPKDSGRGTFFFRELYQEANAMLFKAQGFIVAEPKL